MTDIVDVVLAVRNGARASSSAERVNGKLMGMVHIIVPPGQLYTGSWEISTDPVLDAERQAEARRALEHYAVACELLYPAWEQLGSEHFIEGMRATVPRLRDQAEASRRRGEAVQRAAGRAADHGHGERRRWPPASGQDRPRHRARHAQRTSAAVSGDGGENRTAAEMVEDWEERMRKRREREDAESVPRPKVVDMADVYPGIERSRYMTGPGRKP